MLTRRQREVLDFIAVFIRKNRYAPSFDEIAAGCGMKSISTVYKHLARLEQRGYIKRAFNQTRGIELCRKAQTPIGNGLKVKATGTFVLLVDTNREHLEERGSVADLPAAWEKAVKLL
jgi:SOS-response transcriptional repressor LexA